MNCRKLLLLVVVAAVLLGTAGVGWPADQSQTGQTAQRHPRMRCQERFDAMDTNHDGVVTKDEFMAVRHRGGRGEDVFKSRDQNGDGTLQKGEFCAGKGMGKGMGKGRSQ
jgi:hypothetical protein